MSRKRTSGYANSGASFDKRAFKGWLVNSLSPDEDITYNLPTLRARSRDLYMSTPLAAGAIKTITAGVIGSGLMVHPHIDYKFLGLSEEQAAEWEKETEREWRAFSESTACDASRSLNFYQLQRLLFMSALMSGDCFVAMPYIQTSDTPYRLKAYLVEGDRVCDPANYLHEVVDPTRDIREGIEFGQYGEPLNYYVAKYHPGDTRRTLTPQTWLKIPAFGTSGRRNILHVLDVERPGQRRGVPLLAPVIENLKQMERYTSSELMAAVISSYFTVFLKKTTPSTGLPGFEGGTPGIGGTEDFDPATLRLAQGAVATLPPDTDIEIANPQRPNSLFEGFISAQCRMMGAGIELPYEMLVKQFVASYSASRAAQLEANRTFRIRRETFINQFIRPFYEEWLLEAILLGRIKAPGALEDLMVMRSYAHIDVTGDSVGCLDPTKEVEAAIKRVQYGLSTIQQEAAELNGLAPEDIAAELHKEVELYKGLNHPAVIVERGPGRPRNDEMEADNADSTTDQ